MGPLRRQLEDDANAPAVTEDVGPDDQLEKADVAAMEVVAEKLGAAAHGLYGGAQDARGEPVRWRKMDSHSRQQQSGRGAVTANRLESFHLQVWRTDRICFGAHNRMLEKQQGLAGSDYMLLDSSSQRRAGIAEPALDWDRCKEAQLEQMNVVEKGDLEEGKCQD